MNDPPAQVRPPLRWRLLRAARRLGWAVEGRLRVPAAFVTGSVGKTTTCRMTAAILMAAGHRVGLTTTTGCSVAERPLRSGDSASARWAALVTGQPDCDVAVLEMARGGILNEGIPFTGCDVGAVLNVLDNHLGSDGIETRAQLAAVKGLVVEKARGLAVLNADDPLVLAMQDRTKAREVCLVSRRPESAAVIAHRAAGGLACFLDPEPHGFPHRMTAASPRSRRRRRLRPRSPTASASGRPRSSPACAASASRRAIAAADSRP